MVEREFLTVCLTSYGLLGTLVPSRSEQIAPTFHDSWWAVNVLCFLQTVWCFPLFFLISIQHACPHPPYTVQKPICRRPCFAALLMGAPVDY